MTTVRTSSKGQIAIPKRVRDRLHIKPGQRLAVREQNGSIMLTPIPDDPIEFLCGVFEDEPSMTDDLLREHARDLGHE